jgi:hypothetical protein
MLQIKTDLNRQDSKNAKIKAEREFNAKTELNRHRWRLRNRSNVGTERKRVER